MADYEQGSLVRATATFVNASDVNTDPTTVTVKYRVGSDAAVSKVYGTDAEVIKSATGIYYIDLTVGTSDGTWYVRWEGTGDVVAAVEASFGVKQSQFD
ncbi:MAG: hypothetical protein VW239_02585 [Candidatus Nanopelagicales bacterium]